MTDAELIVWVRFWLSITVDDISDTDLEIIITSVRTQYPSASSCQLKYYLAKATLEHFIRAEAKGQSGQAGSGEISKIKEKIGRREKEVTYDVGTSSSKSSGWNKVLEDLIADPDSVGCKVFPSTEGNGSVVIGVHSEKYELTSPWRRNLNRGIKSTPWKY